MSIYKRIKKINYPEIDDTRLCQFFIDGFGMVMLMLQESNNGESSYGGYIFADLPERMWWESPFS